MTVEIEEAFLREAGKPWHVFTESEVEKRKKN